MVKVGASLDVELPVFFLREDFKGSVIGEVILYVHHLITFHVKLQDLVVVHIEVGEITSRIRQLVLAVLLPIHYHCVETF